MLETPHVIVAAAIATKIGNPALSLPLAFLSHFVLEKVPHWNPHLNTEKKKYGTLTSFTKKIIAIDVTLSLISGFYIASRVLPDINYFITILLACLFGVLPDLIEGPYFFWDWKSKFIDKWMSFQKALQVDTEPIPGLTFQFITIVAAFMWIF